MAKGTKKIKVRLRTAPKTAKAKKSEVSALGQVLRTLGGLGGGALGGMIGQSAAGSGVGTGLAATLSRWLGAGDYTVSQNSIVSSSLRSSNSIPTMHKSGQMITVRHKEYLCAITGSVNFSVQRFFLLQPGDVHTFPWLSGVANKFQQYRVKGMVFHYVPTSGHAVSSTNPAIGSVMIQTSYRANDSPPESKVEMLNEYWASEASPAESFVHPIECAPKENPFQIHYTRTKPVPSNDSPLLYDLGVTYVATQGMQGANPVGDLWVTYEIELIKPQIASSVLGDVYSATLTAQDPVPGSPLGTAITSTSGQAISLSMTARTLTFPVGFLGTYMVYVRVAATTQFTAFDGTGGPAYVNCVGEIFDNGATWTRTVVLGAAATTASGFYVFAVKLNDPSTVATVTIPAMTWTGTAAYTTVYVAAID